GLYSVRNFCLSSSTLLSGASVTEDQAREFSNASRGVLPLRACRQWTHRDRCCSRAASSSGGTRPRENASSFSGEGQESNSGMGILFVSFRAAWFGRLERSTQQPPGIRQKNRNVDSVQQPGQFFAQAV